MNHLFHFQHAPPTTGIASNDEQFTPPGNLLALEGVTFELAGAALALDDACNGHTDRVLSPRLSVNIA